MSFTPSTLAASTRRILSGRIALATATSLLLGLTPHSWAADFIKANNLDNLNVGTSWVGNAAPGLSDVAVWDNTVPGANSTVLGANLSLSGIRIANPGGLVTIGAGNTLTLGASGIDLSASTVDLNLDSTIATLADVAQSWNVAAGRTVTLSTALSRGARSGLNFLGSGTVTLNGNTATSLLPYATFGGNDLAALNASKVVAGATTVFTFVNPNGGNLSGTAVGVDVQTTTAGATQAYRHSNALTVTNGVRFNANNTQNTRWTVDTSSAGRVGTLPVILVTPNVTQDIEYNGSGGIRAASSGGELVINQRGSGNLIFNTTINGNGASSLTKLGSGKLTIASASGYTGATNITEGTVQIGNGGALGSIASASVVNHAILAFNRSDAFTFAPAISGTGAVTVANTGTGAVTLSGANTYTGATNLNSGALVLNVLGNIGNGTAVNFNGGTLTYGAGATADISVRTVTINAGGATIDTAGNNVTLANGIGNAGSGTLTKTGAGTLTMSGTSTFTGATTLTTGGLVVNGSLAGAVNVSAATTLGGSGIIGGTITVNTGGIVAPGNSVGTFTTNSLTLSSGSILNYEFNTSPANDYINVTATNGLTLNGGGFNLFVEGGVTAFSTVGDYNLIGYTGAIGGTGTTALTVLNPQAGKSYLFGSTATNVTLKIETTGFVTDWNVAAGGSWGTGTNWTIGVPNAVGATANLNFPIGAPSAITLDANRTVGALSFDSAQSYTVAEGAGGTLIIDNGPGQGNVIGTNGSHTVSSPVTLNSNTVAAIASGSLLTISGPVGGLANLTKSNSGILDLTNSSNGLSGNITIVGGTLGFAALGSLGSGNLTIDGGMLRYNTGNTADISVKTVTIGAGGASVDTNGNDVGFANPIGNAGSGGLTKTGAGTLTLAAANTHTGATTITGGTLSVGSNANLGDPATGAGLTFNGGTMKTTATFALDNAGANLRSVAIGAGGGTFSTDDATTLTVGGTVSGSGPLNKIGAGILALTANNAASFSGAVTLNEGTLRLGGAQANGQQALGTGTVTFNSNTTLSMNGAGAADNATSYGNLTNALSVPAGQTGNLIVPKRVTVSSALTGAGTLNVQVDGTRGEFQGNWSAFTGQINLTGAGEFRLIGFQNQVFNNAKLNVGAGVFVHQLFNPPSSGALETVQAIGELNGAVGAIIGGNPVSGRFVNWTVGSLNTDSTYAGVIQNDAGAARLTKVGGGTLNLSGTNTYTGSTTINTGTLAISNGAALGDIVTGTTIAGGDTTARLALSGDIAVAEPLVLAGKAGVNVATAHLFNTSGSNSLSGSIDLALGGTDYNIEAAADTLTVTGNLTPVTATGARNVNLQGAGAGVWSGNLTDGSAVVAIQKRGAGTWTLSGTNAYTGPTVVSAGTLEISGTISGTTSLDISGGSLLLAGVLADRIINAPAVNLSGGTLGYASGVSSASESMGNLTLAANSTLDFGAGTGNTLLFSGLSLGSSTLSIYNWSGSPYSIGQSDDGSNLAQDRLLFDVSSLPANALGQISFYSDAGSTFLGHGHEISFGGDFEIVPVPEPSTTGLIAAAGLLGLVGMRERRRKIFATAKSGR